MKNVHSICLSSALVLACIGILGGCASSRHEIRSLHAKEYHQALVEYTHKQLPENHELRLKDCLKLAWQNNLKGKTAEIEARLKKLEKNIAFSYFFPTLEISANYTSWDHQPKRVTGASAIAMNDKEIRDVVIKAQMPIFVPSAWYLYSMRARGEAIGDLIYEYTRQMITLNVTAVYYQCLILEEASHALESQVLAAKALQEELNSLKEEGLAMGWEAKKAQNLVLARQLDCNSTKRAYHQAKADLLMSMGLSPMAEVNLVGEAPLQCPDKELKDMVLQALLDNPQLHIADRGIEIQKDAVKAALANFLPNIIGFASFNTTSDSYVFDTHYWMSGLSGLFSVFNGFASVNEYRTARARKEKALVERDELCLSIMLQVIKAHCTVQNAEEELELATSSCEVASERLSQIEAKSLEGLLKLSEMLNAVADRDCAQMNVIKARFQQQVSIASLLHVMGVSYSDNYED
ncbi:MAG: TolC family protein [bacterium]